MRLGIDFSSFATLITSSHKFSLIGWNDLALAAAHFEMKLRHWGGFSFPSDDHVLLLPCASACPMASPSLSLLGPPSLRTRQVVGAFGGEDRVMKNGVRQFA